MMWKEVAMRALPPKPKITPDVWTGRRRPKLDQAASKRRLGQASWEAIQTPIPMPTTAQNRARRMPTFVGSS